ncbi:MAG: hypothetical protein DRJ64_07300 [Thermoprotei archaeon]|nr:MAG: hypothetical protein DRJ64_07300 [Thermoprotei archaeon]
MKMANVGLEFIDGQIYIVEYNKRENVKQKKNVTQKYMDILREEFSDATITTNDSMYNTTVTEWSDEEKEEYQKEQEKKRIQSADNYQAFITSDIIQSGMEYYNLVNRMK